MLRVIGFLVGWAAGIIGAVALYAAAAFGLAPEACVVVDDSPSGCRAGVAGGFRTLGFATGFHGAEDLHAVGAETFTDMAALPGLIGLAS